MDCISDNIKVPHQVEMYNILWLVNYLETQKGNLSVALCSKECKTAFITTANDELKPMIVQDVIINENSICEDSSFCLNIGCQHNDNNPDNFAAAMKIPVEDVEFDALVQRCQEINEYTQDEFNDYTHGSLKLFEKPYLAWK